MSLDVDTMLHAISDGDSDTGSAADDADEGNATDNDLPTNDLPYDNNDQVRINSHSVYHVQTGSHDALVNLQSTSAFAS